MTAFPSASPRANDAVSFDGNFRPHRAFLAVTAGMMR